MKSRALATLIRLARAEAEARQIEVAQLGAAIRELDERDRALVREIEMERAGAGAAMGAFGAFVARINKARAALALERGRLLAVETHLRAALADAFLEMKKLEQVQETKGERARRAAQAQEAAALDAASTMKRPGVASA